MKMKENIPVNNNEKKRPVFILVPCVCFCTIAGEIVTMHEKNLSDKTREENARIKCVFFKPCFSSLSSFQISQCPFFLLLVLFIYFFVQLGTQPPV